jgi:hypothetical protein
LCLVASDRPGADRQAEGGLGKHPPKASRIRQTVGVDGFPRRRFGPDRKKSTASPFSVDEFLREVPVLYEKT